MNAKKWALPGGLAVLLVAGAAWALKSDAVQWIHVPEPRDEHAQFFYERSLTTSNSLVQRRRVLVNYKERGSRNEASFIYDYEFDCFTDRYEAQGAKSYFSANGKGEIIREYPKERLGMSGGLGVQAVQRELCSKVTANLSGQEPYAIGLWDLPLHSFLECQHRRYKDGRNLFERIRSRVNPIEKKDSGFTYQAKGEIGGYEINMPVRAITLGVCNASGESACGAASFVALHVDWPVDATRARLKNYRRSGKDFTVESREAESGATRRPVLIADPKNPKGSVLYCDAGNL